MPVTPGLEPCEDTPETLILGTSRSCALLYGIHLAVSDRVCICAESREELATRIQETLGYIFRQKGRSAVLIDDDEGRMEAIAGAFPACRYVRGGAALDALIEDMKPELNARLEDEEARRKDIFVLIGEFHAFFDGMTDLQAAFMRKVFRYIDAPRYGMHFLCGFDVRGGHSLDSLFISLVSGVDNYLLSPDSYEGAAAVIETMPALRNLKKNAAYLCIGDRASEIRW